jgi:pyrimidine deaminase RibD-like protein
MDNDLEFMKRAIEESRRCKGEDNRLHPMVGAVVVKNGKILATAYRGEGENAGGNHAEFIALETKLRRSQLAGATVYTTLEPCTTRNHPKVPCAQRLIDRKVSRVVIGMLDPNQMITGRGIRKLRDATLAVDLVPPQLMAEAEELNRDFTRSQSDVSVTGTVVRGLPEITALIEKLCLKAERNIRLFIHALGAEYKIPDAVANRLAREIKNREKKGNPLRLHPIIVVDQSIPLSDLLKSLAQRGQIYVKHGVHEFTKPRFLQTGTPVGIDVLVIDHTHALFCITTAQGSKQTQIGIVFEQHPKLILELIDWFEHIIRGRAMSLEEFRAMALLGKAG